MRLHELVALGLLTLGLVGLSGADTVILAPTDDMYTDPEHPGAHPAGELWVANYAGAGHFQRINIKFDLSGISGNVESATLSFYRFFMCPSHPSTTTDIYAIEQDWNENTWPENQHIPHGSDVWATYTFGPDNPAWFHVDITELAQAWVEGGTTNFGLVIHAKSGEKFSKFRSKEYTNPNQHPYLTVTYAGTATYSISGNTCTEDEAPLSGVTVVLSGDAYDQTTTNVDGWYSFSNLDQGGAYTVTPSFSNEAGVWFFDPQTRTYENLQGDQWSQDYTVYAPRYTIAGTVNRNGRTPVEDVTMILSGYQSAEIDTNQEGWYQFNDLRGGQSYTVTPSYNPEEGAWTFDPESRVYDFLDSDHWSDDYSGTPPHYMISGTVTEEDRGALEGVRIVLSGDVVDTAYTGQDGNYALGPLTGGGYYTVEPFHSPAEGPWAFDPEQYQFQPLIGPQMDADFVGLRPRYSISGTIKGRENSGIEGVLIKLDGGKTDSVFTDHQGDYSLTDVPGGLAYGITPSLALNDSVIWYFSPENIQIDTLMANHTGLEFLAQLPVLLCVGDGEGQPGSTGNPVDINLDNETYNSSSIDSLTFVLLFTSANGAHLPAEGALELVGRAEGFDVVYQVNEENPAACSLHATLTGDDPLPPGTDVICHLLFSLDAEADTAYATSLSFATASARDTMGMLIPVDLGDTGIFGSGVGASAATRPIKLKLLPPTPNPSKGAVRFSFQIPRNSRTTVVISDLAGRIVTRLDQGMLETGIHSILWDGSSHDGQALPSGAYHCRLVSCGENAQNTVVLLR